MTVEMHSHTAEHSECSHVTAAELVKKTFQVGLQAIVLTDHHYLWSEEELDQLRKESGVPEIFRVLSRCRHCPGSPLSQ